MDAEGLGRKLLLIPPMTPEEPHGNQTVGTVTASHKMLTLHALSSSLDAGTAKRGCLAEERFLGDLRQSVTPKRPRPFTHSRSNNKALILML